MMHNKFDDVKEGKMKERKMVRKYLENEREKKIINYLFQAINYSK